MGCDIHMYLEYTTKKELKEAKKTGKAPYWRDFAGHINPGRNYDMFGFISQGVRSNHKNGLPPKGLPPFEELGYYSRNDSVCYISDSPSENTVTLETAMRWAESGRLKIIKDRNDKPCWVEHPDWHSHTWLTTKEFETAINRYAKYCSSSEYDFGAPIEYMALLSAMKTFEENGYVSRMIVWFDN
jgi:hypothetical protein